MVKGESRDESKGKLDFELRRGVLVLSVLSQLQTAQYGYSLRQALAGAGMPIEEGTLYPLLRRLESLGLLISEWRIEDGPPAALLQAEPRRGAALPRPERELVGACNNGEPPDRQEKVGVEAMNATEVIETYIDDTVRLLPRQQRDDVAAELRSLLNEEMHAQAEQIGPCGRRVPGVIAGARLWPAERGRGPLSTSLGHHRSRRLHEFS